MEIREFHPYDLDGLILPEFEPCLGGATRTEHAQALMTIPGAQCFTATVDGEPIACIGLFPWWRGRKYAWAYLRQDFQCNALSLTRAVHRWLRYHGEGRIETAIDPADEKAIRWAERFGFKREGLMRQYLATGRDMYLYARIG